MNSKQQQAANSGRLTIRIHRAKPLPASQQTQPERRSNPFAEAASSNNTALQASKLKRWVQEYTIDANEHDSLLDALLTIKRSQDPSLTFRYACAHGMCGSDGVLINGQPALLCKSKIGSYAKPALPHARSAGEGSFRRTVQATLISQSQPTEATGSMPAPYRPAPAPTEASQSPQPEGNWLGVIEVAPIPGFPILRDLIVDTDTMFRQIKQVEPYLQPSQSAQPAQSSDPADLSGEYLQTPAQLQAYEALSNCIACGVCEGACPIYAGGEAFIGPAALVAASRFVHDSRDAHTLNRLDAIDSAEGIRACQAVRACTRYCPRGIDIADTIWSLVQAARR
ncbi:(2Fe-2S)-binding protein [Bombiscardovia apis]|uniref:succinate dehydrogenase n=1 Tax=Bombiscardovia apis TaxID=2932182 RepID=A0ABM8BBY5_9BIFI|nr:2Fe-2S iron-sulfur cluster-binding protein [Bombiscardovia apis]BDR54419.1 (2Fe-2S)-binding protein [Bombiscardovia apis]